MGKGSSHFKRRRHRLKTPQICISGAIPWPVLPHGNIQPLLAGMCHWRDLDPMQPTDVAAYVDLHETVNQTIWEGTNPTSGPRIGMKLIRLGATNPWKLELRLWDQWRNPELFTFPTFNLDPSKPLDTRFIYDVLTPRVDFRMARVIA